MSVFSDFSMLDLLEFYFSAIWLLSSLCYLMRNVAILSRIVIGKVSKIKRNKTNKKHKHKQD